MTNISKELFKEVGRGRTFELAARSEKHKVIYDRYTDIVKFDVPAEKRDVDGRALVIFNTAGLIEIATYRSNPLTLGSASTLFGLQLDAPVIINFENK